LQGCIEEKVVGVPKKRIVQFLAQRLRQHAAPEAVAGDGPRAYALHNLGPEPEPRVFGKYDGAAVVHLARRLNDIPHRRRTCHYHDACPYDGTGARGERCPAENEKESAEDQHLYGGGEPHYAVESGIRGGKK
jgi:hypothetical protein